MLGQFAFLSASKCKALQCLRLPAGVKQNMVNSVGSCWMPLYITWIYHTVTLSSTNRLIDRRYVLAVIPVTPVRAILEAHWARNFIMATGFWLSSTAWSATDPKGARLMWQVFTPMYRTTGNGYLIKLIKIKSIQTYLLVIQARRPNL